MKKELRDIRMEIRTLNRDEQPPMELLLLADPSQKIVEEYIAIHHAKLHNFKTIEVGTGNSSIGQLALYQKCGFRITGVDRDFFIRHYIEEIFESGIQDTPISRFIS